MRVPQVSERVKELPAQALRGVFAGVGQLLLITDKLRNKTPAGQQVPPARRPVPSATGAAAAEVPVAAEVPEVGPTADTDADAEATGATARPAGEPGVPLPNYDELSIASLRARLRNLDITQVRQLDEYERAHAARADVIGMFERRIVKLEAGASKDAPAEAGAQEQIQAQEKADTEAQVEAQEEVAAEARDEVEGEAEEEV